MRFDEFSTQEYVTVNKRLNPKLWSKGQLDPQVTKQLIKIAKAFEEFIGVDLPVTDVTVTGSNANFMWTRHSDLDLHLIIPGVAPDAARELYSAKKALWSEEHQITVKGIPVECYVQGSEEPHHSTGIYSVLNKEWLVKPRKAQPKINDVAVEEKLRDLAAQIESSLADAGLEELKKLKERISTMRKSGLERAGEWSTENVVFKVLRADGLIDQLADRVRELEDQDLSLESQVLS